VGTFGYNKFEIDYIYYMDSTDNRIEALINAAQEGTIFLTRDFSDLGSAGAVSVSLHRLCKRNAITRLARGIYAKPEISKLLNKEVRPSLDKIAKAIARRDKARIHPTGSYALYQLGLSTQIPLNVVYYTDGKARKVKVNDRTIQFKKTTPKKLSYRGELSRLIILAMSEIGKGKLKEEEERRLKELIKKEDIVKLKHDIQLAPQWIAEFLAKASQE